MTRKKLREIMYGVFSFVRQFADCHSGSVTKSYVYSVYNVYSVYSACSVDIVYSAYNVYNLYNV